MTRTKKNERINNLRKWFNEGKPHCDKCGRLYVTVRNLAGTIVVEQACPNCGVS